MHNILCIRQIVSSRNKWVKPVKRINVYFHKMKIINQWWCMEAEIKLGNKKV